MLKKYFYGKHYIDKDNILEINKSLKNQLSQRPFLKQFEKNFQNILMLNIAPAIFSSSCAFEYN